MNARAREALAKIRQCVATDRYLVLKHFVRRRDQRCLFWPDVQAVLNSPSAMEDAGTDKLNRPKWIVTGKATDGYELEIVCILDVDAQGDVAVFMTAYWGED